jgi:hypothetical protein
MHCIDSVSGETVYFWMRNGIKQNIVWKMFFGFVGDAFLGFPKLRLFQAISHR